MEDWKLVLLTSRVTSFSIECAAMGYLNLTDQQLIRLYEECLVMAEYIEDCSSQMRVNIYLGDLCRETKKITEAITYFEKALAVQTNDIFEAYAFGQLGIIYNSLGNSNQGLLYVEKCLAIAISTGMKVLEEMAYRHHGIIYYSKGEYLTAIDCHQKALAMSQELNDKNSEGYSYYHLGNCYWSLDMSEESKKWYKKCLSVISLMNDKPIEETVYERLSMIYQSSGKHDKSIRYSEKLLHLVKDNNDSESEAWVYGNLGQAYKSLDKDDEAIEYYTKQLVLAEAIDSKEQIKKAHYNFVVAYHSMEKNFEVIKHSEKLLTISIKAGDKKAQMAAYGVLENCCRSVSDFYKAIEYCKEFLIIALETNDKYTEMTVYRKMGEAYSSLGKYDEVIGYQKKALNIAEEIEDTSTKGFIYGRMGMVFESLGEYHKALNYCLKELRIARETGDKKHELSSYEKLGMIYSGLSKYHKSLQCCEKVLDLQRETGLTEYIPNTLANMESVYKSVGKCDNTSVKCYEMELSSCQKRGDREGEGICYINMSIAYEEQGKYQEAMDCSKKSLTIAQDIGDKKGEGISFIRLGCAYLCQNRYNEAVDCFERSLLIANEIGSKNMELDAYSSLGDLYVDWKEYEKAVDYQEKALKLAVSLGIKGAELTASRKLGSLYYLKATIFKEMHHINDENMCIKQCKKHLEQSLQCCEWIFDHLEDRDDCKVTIMDKFIETYKLLTSVLIKTGEFDRALIVSDRCRARALADLLESKYSGEGPQYGKNVILTYAEVDSILHTCESEFCVLYFSVQSNAVVIWVLAHENPLFFVEVNAQGFEQLPTSQGNNDGSEIISEVVFAAYDAMNVRDTLSCEDRSLDHLPENVRLTKSDDCFVRGEHQEEEESRAPDQNKRMLQEVAPDEKKNFSEGNKSLLESLYTDLIAPVIQNLVHEEVVIVPDGPLYMVPFAALRDPETGLFLSEMKRIRLAPSLTTLKSLQECPSDYHSNSGALVVGDPDSGTVMFQGEEKTFWSLPKAQHEAKIIGKILDVAPLLGAQATKDVIMQRLHEGVAVIHIAAHGSTKGEIVLAPRTLTGGRKIPEEEDYMLTRQEVQKTGIKAQLVVLSCCHSGRGEIRAEGIVGISRGFLAAGARAVVASLWAIDDEATLNFMVSFYTQLKMGESASKSLQLAMNDVRGDDEEPRHWAPFFLIGDDVTINI